MSVILLAGAKIITPPSQAPRFEEQLLSGNTFRANQGYEFDICHVSRSTIRFCAPSQADRDLWVSLFSNASSTNSSSSGKPPPAPDASTVITSIKLAGLSLQCDPPSTSLARHAATKAPPATEQDEDTQSTSQPQPARKSSFTVSAVSMMLLERTLQKKISDQNEARNREQRARIKLVRP